MKNRILLLICVLLGSACGRIEQKSAALIWKYKDGTKDTTTVMLNVVKNHLSLRVTKEALALVDTLVVLPEFANAVAGEEGAWINPSGFVTRFREGREGCFYRHKKHPLPIIGYDTPRGFYMGYLRSYRYDVALVSAAKGNHYTFSIELPLVDIEPYEDFCVDFYKLEGGEATYSGMGRLYRKMQMDAGVIKPLSERVKTRPELKYVVENPEVRIRQCWKPVPTPVIDQTLENEPELRVKVTFDRVKEIVDEMKRQGVKAELCLVGWNLKGHDGRFPTHFPPEPELGGESALRELIKYAQENGFQIVPHICTCDAYKVSEDWDEADVAKRHDGSLSTHAIYGSGRMYNLCYKVSYEKYAQKLHDKLADLGFRGIPNFRTPGNHDSLVYNYALNNNDYFDEDELFKFYGAYNTGAVFQSGEEDRGYCYRDFDNWKLRVITLNTCDLKGLDPSAGGTEYTSGTQMQWFAQTLDLSSKSNASDWNILIFSHHPLDYSISILCNRILKAYLEGRAVDSFTRDGITISYDYTNKNKASIIGNIHGHNHNYLKDNLRWLVSGSTTEAIKANRMCVPNACYLRSNERGQNNKVDAFDIEFGETTTYDKTSSTAKDTSFYVITVDPVTKTVYADHYGAGYSQYWSYAKSYTNLIRFATTERGGTEIYNGIGYKTNTRVNSSFAVVDYDGMCLTGWIPYKAGDVCRIKNVTVTGSATPYFVRWQKDASNLSTMDVSYIGQPDANGVYTFTVHNTIDGHFRLSFGNISNNTIITLNEEISGEEAEAPVTYTVTNNLANITTNNTDTNVAYGQSYSATLSVNSGYTLENISVTMGGTNITSSAYANGVITISNVTGNIVITATASLPNYTNVVKTAQVFTNGNTSALEGVGYKDGYYQSSSGGIGSAASGYTCTGAIPYARKSNNTYPTIYVKGGTFDTTSRSRVYFYSTSKGILDPANIGGTGSNMTNVNKYITKEELGDGYWRFVPTSTLNSSASLNNQTVGFIAMSLLGSGANLIITLDEPIE